MSNFFARGTGQRGPLRIADELQYPFHAMTKISSSYSKRAPLIGACMGLVALVGAIAIPLAQSGKPLPLPAYLPMLVIPLVIYIMYKFFHDLVDEVWDAGDTLVVKNNGLVLRIPLAEIINVNYSGMSNPPRVTLALRNPTQLGKEIVFIVRRPLTFSLSMRNAIVDDLIQRIDAARRKG